MVKLINNNNKIKWDVRPKIENKNKSVRNKQPMREVEVCNLVRRKEGGVVSLFLC
jgi:hypothetical protein